MTTLLDTRVVPLSERPDYWSAGIAEHFFPISFGTIGAGPFEGRLTGGQVGPITVRSMRGVPHRVMRTTAAVAAGDPESILLYLVREGSCRIEQDDRSTVLRAGDIGWQDTSRPSAFQADSGFELLALALPKWFLGARAEVYARRAAMRIAGGGAPFAHLAGPFVAGLARAADAGGLSGVEGDTAAEMLLTMLRAFEGDEASGPASRSTALLAQMRRYLLENLDDPDLGPGELARAHFVSTRYVHKLFAASGTSVASWIREQRMERARQELETSLDASVAAVALRSGYRDPASFSRAFREAYGMSPRDVRRSLAA